MNNWLPRSGALDLPGSSSSRSYGQGSLHLNRLNAQARNLACLFLSRGAKQAAYQSKTSGQRPAFRGGGGNRIGPGANVCPSTSAEDYICDQGKDSLRDGPSSTANDRNSVSFLGSCVSFESRSTFGTAPNCGSTCSESGYEIAPDGHAGTPSNWVAAVTRWISEENNLSERGPCTLPHVSFVKRNAKMRWLA
jgi:hypothetical protein